MKPILISIIIGIGIVIVAAGFLTRDIPVEKIVSDDFKTPTQEREIILAEIDEQLGTITASPCLNLYNKIQGLENTYENVDEKSSLLRDYINLRCNDTADQWSPERKAQIEKKELLETLRAELAKTPECIDLNQIYEDHLDTETKMYDEQGLINDQIDEVQNEWGSVLTECHACLQGEYTSSCVFPSFKESCQKRIDLRLPLKVITESIKEQTVLVDEAQENYNVKCVPELDNMDSFELP